MTHVRAELNQSERRVCRVLGQARSTQRYEGVPRDGDEHLVRRMHELVRLHPCRGYRMIWGMLRLEGWRVNRKRGSVRAGAQRQHDPRTTRRPKPRCIELVNHARKVRAAQTTVSQGCDSHFRDGRKRSATQPTLTPTCTILHKAG